MSDEPPVSVSQGYPIVQVTTAEVRTGPHMVAPHEHAIPEPPVDLHALLGAVRDLRRISGMQRYRSDMMWPRYRGGLRQWVSHLERQVDPELIETIKEIWCLLHGVPS